MKRSAYVALAAAGIAISGMTPLWGQSPDETVNADHAECAYYGPKRAQFMENTLTAARRSRSSFSEETEAIVARLGGLAATQQFVPGGSRTFSSQKGSNSGNLVDKHI